jgi:hypothetical protein
VISTYAPISVLSHFGWKVRDALVMETGMYALIRKGKRGREKVGKREQRAKKGR